MRNVVFTLCSLSLSGILMLGGCKSSDTKAIPAAGATGITSAMPVNGAKIAYVNIDSLEAKYEYLKSKREEFKKRQEQMETELQSSYQKMQGDASEIQKKAEARTLTQPEYETAQKRLLQMEKSLETRKQALTEQLVKEQDDFNKDLKARLDAFISEYNKNHGYDYILSYSGAGSSILYVNKQLDITKDIVDGMNATAKNDAGKK